MYCILYIKLHRFYNGIDYTSQDDENIMTAETRAILNVITNPNGRFTLRNQDTTDNDSRLRVSHKFEKL